jgi:hypothetical protein
MAFTPFSCGSRLIHERGRHASNVVQFRLRVSKNTSGPLNLQKTTLSDASQQQDSNHRIFDHGPGLFFASICRCRRHSAMLRIESHALRNMRNMAMMNAQAKTGDQHCQG